jgi:DeoR family transcriptional regulator, aga operon transcriptional repressor
MVARSRNYTVDRRKKILGKINTEGQVLVHELSNEFKVSEVTIRNDLEQLERKNLLIRARGGAMKIEAGVAREQHLSDKDKLHYEEKSRIGKLAAGLINDRDTIVVDSGTTTIEMIKNLPELTELTVICNALNIINQLIKFPFVNIIVPGGYLRKTSLSLVGPLAEKNLQNLYVDKVFLGVDGIDTKHGIYTPNIEEAHLNEIMIHVSREVIILTDSSKFLRRSLAYICGIEKVHTIVTDKGIIEDDRKRLEDAGIKILVA